VALRTFFFCFSLAAFAPVPLSSAQPTLPFALPATFVGVGPCGDCGGYIAVTLTLHPNNALTERDVYRRGGSSRLSGTWRYEYSSDNVILSHSSRVHDYYRILDARTIEPLDYLGDPIVGGCVFRLRIGGTSRPCLVPRDSSPLADLAASTKTKA